MKLLITIATVLSFASSSFADSDLSALRNADDQETAALLTILNEEPLVNSLKKAAAAEVAMPQEACRQIVRVAQLNGFYKAEDNSLEAELTISQHCSNRVTGRTTQLNIYASIHGGFLTITDMGIDRF